MKPGDIGFAHTTGIMGRAIRFGEAIRGAKNDAKWNHAFIIYQPVSEGKDTDWYVIQAEASGVTCDKLLSEVAPGGDYEIIYNQFDAEKVLAFAESQVGAKYGFVTIASCVLDILLPDSICLRKSDSWICSGLVAASLMFAGWPASTTVARADLYSITPAELHESLQT